MTDVAESNLFVVAEMARFKNYQREWQISMT